VDPSSLYMTNMRPDKTWMSSILIAWREPRDEATHQVVVSTEVTTTCMVEGKSRSRHCMLGGSAIVDGLPTVQLGWTQAGSVQIGTSNSRSFSRVQLKSSHMEIYVDCVLPPDSWAVEDKDVPEFSHLNLKIVRVHLSSEAHGILGQTARPKLDTRQQLIVTTEGPNGEGLLDGSIEDYVLESLTSTRFVYSVFGTSESQSGSTVSLSLAGGV